MKRIRPKKWSEFQHYKDRYPPWIKLHKAFLDDYDFQQLPIASRALAPMLWLLASEYPNGEIPADVRKIAFRLRVALQDFSDAFEPLLRAGFFEIIGNDDNVASEPLASGQQVAVPEIETQVRDTSEETETEKRPLRAARSLLNGSVEHFLEFYNTYPLHKARRAAEKAYVSALKRGSPDAILAGAVRYRDDPKRDPDKTKHPATWLNADCWLDEAESAIESAPDFALKKLRELEENGTSRQ